MYILVFLALGPMIETMSQWKSLISFGDTALASTICYCLNFQQGLRTDENPEPKLISPRDIEGKTKLCHLVSINSIELQL